uniref:Uncharacterized protein n=1 Tax=Arundo donax TaxID=35708 RepID=A0A0A9HE86_ARUDO
MEPCHRHLAIAAILSQLTSASTNW